MKLFSYQISTSVKRFRGSYKRKQVLDVFRNLNALILDYNSVKVLELPKLWKKLCLKGYGAIQNQKNVSADNYSQNIWKQP